MHGSDTKYGSPGDFFVFYILNNVNKKTTICLIKKIIRTFVDPHVHIPFYH